MSQPDSSNDTPLHTATTAAAPFATVALRQAPPRQIATSANC
jgi:hypothetical protein